MPQRILIIEDDVDLADMVSEYLSTHGHSTNTQHTATKGLVAFESENFDALILDLMLPDLDGFEVCRQIRAKSDVPIVMLTARGEEMDRIVGLELGADDYLPKPFNPRELLARLNAIFRRGTITKQGTPAMRFGRLVIDPNARQVSVAGELKNLTGYQFNLLHALAANAGRVMSRESLMDHLRGDDLEPFDRSIDVHISRIRSAIEDDPKKPLRILTIRGVGYVFSKLQDSEEHQ
ncbi:MAG: response regulator transcription factor [Pseudomonadota bacterium]